MKKNKTEIKVQNRLFQTEHPRKTVRIKCLPKCFSNILSYRGDKCLSFIDFKKKINCGPNYAHDNIFKAFITGALN